MRSKAILALSLLSFTTTPALAETVQPKVVTAPVEKIFVPAGFDDNDNVEIVLHGHFPSACYKTGPSTATVDEATKTVTIAAKAYLYSGACAQVVVPYIQSIKVGLVNIGSYKVQVADLPQTESAPLTITHAKTTAPDDFLYAPVETANVIRNSQGQPFVRMEGNWPFTFVGCVVMKEVRVVETDGHVLVVQPISEFADGDACEGQRHSKAFQIDTAIPTPLTEAEYLLHVRVMNGNSFNRFLDLTIH